MGKVKGYAEGRWRWRGNALYLDYPQNGRRVRAAFAKLRTGSASERRNLEAQADARLRELCPGIRQSRTALFESELNFPTYKQGALHYWEKRELLKQYIADSSHRAAEWSKLQHGVEYFDQTPMSQIARESVKAFRMHLGGIGRDRGWKPAYINRIVAKVGQVYHYCIGQESWQYATAPAREAERYGNIDLCVRLTNPIHGLPRLTEALVDIYVPTPAEFLKGYMELPETLRRMALVAVHTGLRKRNVVMLRRDECDFDSREIRIHDTKTGVPVVCSMHPEVYELLLTLCDEDQAAGEFVFHDQAGKPVTRFEKEWNAAWKRAEVRRVLFKNLRTTYTSWRIEEGAPIDLLQAALGHTSPMTTARHYNRARCATKILIMKQRTVLSQPVTIRRDDSVTVAG
jgi:integrase